MLNVLLIALAMAAIVAVVLVFDFIRDWIRKLPFKWKLLFAAVFLVATAALLNWIVPDFVDEVGELIKTIFSKQ